MFDITINFAYLYKLLAQPNPFAIMWYLIRDVGWIVLVILALLAIKWWWLRWRQIRYMESHWSFTLLAVNIPKDNIQSPKAVEYIFSQLAGAFMPMNLIEKWWKGKVPEAFSLEIVSDGGYLQFYIWTMDKFRDLVEAAFYAQYPDAIITEVEDYAKNFKNLRFPNDKYDMWATELSFTKNDAYPIRTYPTFEHTLSQELKDPMASLLEILSHMKPGEKAWMQLVIIPQTIFWSKKFEGIVKKLTKQGGGEDKNWFDKIIDIPLKTISFLNDVIFPGPAEESGPEDQFMLMRLTPGEADVLKAVQGKLSKIAFQTTFRIIYLSPNELFSAQRGISGPIGALQQFSTLDLNALLPSREQTTKINYFMIKTREAFRKNLLLRKYIGRAADGHKLMLNIEELATLYHFPMETVKAPLLVKTEAKRGEPPIALPAERVAVPEILLPTEEGGGGEPASAKATAGEEEKDEFISLLEEVAIKREGGEGGDEEIIPEDLLENKIENNNVEKNAGVEEAIEKPVVEKREEKSGGKKRGAVIQDRGGVPVNLPVGN